MIIGGAIKQPVSLLSWLSFGGAIKQSSPAWWCHKAICPRLVICKEQCLSLAISLIFSKCEILATILTAEAWAPAEVFV